MWENDDTERVRNVPNLTQLLEGSAVPPHVGLTAKSTLCLLEGHGLNVCPASPSSCTEALAPSVTVLSGGWLWEVIRFRWLGHEGGVFMGQVPSREDTRALARALPWYVRAR